MEKLGLNFGLVIAYLIPGFLGLYALSERVVAIKNLLGGDNKIPEKAAIVPLLVLALAIGMIINSLGWGLIRPLIALSGVRRPEKLDYTKLTASDIKVYNVIVEDNFRYHQFYSNMLVAVLLLAPLWWVRPFGANVVRNVSFLIVVVVMFMAARDSLKRAYTRMLALQK